MICGDHVLDGSLVVRYQIDAKSICKCKQVASSMTVTFDVLCNQLLDTGGRHRNQPLFIAPFELYFVVECLLERGFQIQRDWGLLAFGALWITASPRFELIFLRRTPRTDFIVGRLGCRSTRSMARRVSMFFGMSNLRDHQP